MKHKKEDVGRLIDIIKRFLHSYSGDYITPYRVRFWAIRKLKKFEEEYSKELNINYRMKSAVFTDLGEVIQELSNATDIWKVHNTCVSFEFGQDVLCIHYNTRSDQRALAIPGLLKLYNESFLYRLQMFIKNI
jgi:hypothetical protein